MRLLLTCLMIGLSALSCAAEAPTRIPDPTRQLVVTVTDGWNTHRGTLYQFSRTKDAGPWNLASETTPVLLGKAGLAWGRGLLPVPHGANGIPSKQERDTRAPAGCFKIGMLFGYAAKAPQGITLPYYQVTAKDCWIDDSNHPDYNRHVVVNPQQPPLWYDKQKMRLGDFAYELMLEVRHNTDPPQAGAGSAIFFHIRRGPDSPTHGCTTMTKANLISLTTWLKPEAKPLYVLLPRQEYNARIKSWGLPAIPP
jgi:L,D-peptidoglycan transpeptidase YkuD (ErfK/YbiS/YcfS/YnhG family)